MKTTMRIWVGVGAYLISSAAPMIPSLSDPGSVTFLPAAEAQEQDPCRIGMGGEGGEGGEGAKPTPPPKAGGEGGEGGEGATPAQNPEVNAGILSVATTNYKAYVLEQVDDLLARTQAFTDKVIAGDVAGAKALYATTRLPWERIEPIAESFAEFDGAIDARVDDFSGPEDPEFTGFHRLERALFEKNSAQGMKPIAEKLLTDIKGLKSCVFRLQIEPGVMVRGASELIEEVAQGKITGEEDRYSKTDFYAFKANIEGSEKIVELIRPLVSKADPKLLGSIDQGFATVNQRLARYATPNGGYKPYDQITAEDKQALQASLAKLAEDLSQLRGVLGA